MQKITENHLKEGLLPEKFQNFQKISKRTFTCSYFNSPNFYTIKRMELPLENQKSFLEEIQKEILIFEKLQQSQNKPKHLPHYFGYFIEESKNHQFFFNSVFDYVAISLKDYIRKHQQNQNFIDYAKIKLFFGQLLHGMAFMQSIEMSHKYLKPSNIFLDESENLKFMDFGCAKDVEIGRKKLKEEYALVNTIGTRKAQFSISKGEAKAYIPPEICDLMIVKTDLQKDVNTYKGDVFAFGVIMIEIATLKKISWKGDLQKLGKELRSNLNEMKNNYYGEIENDKISEFEGIMTIIREAVNIDVETRPDFLRLFGQKIAGHKENFLNYIKLEEMSDLEVKNLFKMEKNKEFVKSSNETTNFLCQKLEIENKLLLEEKERLEKKIELLENHLIENKLKTKSADNDSSSHKNEIKKNEKNYEEIKMDETKFKRFHFLLKYYYYLLFKERKIKKSYHGMEKSPNCYCK